MTRVRRPRLEQELREGAGHVCYEFWMMKEAADMTGWKATVSSPVTISPAENVKLEAFLLHYRNLRAFLCPTRHSTKPNDVVGCDFLGLATERDIGNIDALMKDNGRLDQMLAHITYARIRHIREGNADWPIASMFETMSIAFCEFLESLPDNRRVWFLEERSGAVREAFVKMKATAKGA